MLLLSIPSSLPGSLPATRSLVVTVGGVPLAFDFRPVARLEVQSPPATLSVAAAGAGFEAAHRYSALAFDAAGGEIGAAALRWEILAGTAGTLKVQARCIPWTNVDWDTAAQTCLAYHPPYSHLMRDDEWTALAVWSMIEGLTVYGNNNFLKDEGDPSVTFLDDPIYGGSKASRALTGTGTRATWSGDTNLTTHTGTTAGIYDLNGNVWEWTGSLGGASTSGNYVLGDVDTGESVGTGNISALSTDARLRRYGLPGATAGETPLLGRDYFEVFTTSPNKPQRGGSWGWGPSAGIWTLVVTNPRSTTSDGIGFRPALRY